MKNALVIVGLASMLALSLVMFIVFATAYASPTKSVSIKINTYGEASVELAMLMFLLPFSVFATLLVARETAGKNKINETKEENKLDF